MKTLLKRLSFPAVVMCIVLASFFGAEAFTPEQVESAEEKGFSADGAYLSSETTDRTEYGINSGWKFKFGAGDDYGVSVDDSSWETVDVPHTWNAVDGTNGNYDYKRGKGMYRKQVQIPDSFADSRIYIEFEGVNAVSSLYIDGTLVPFVYENGEVSDTHNGGYTKFRYDITDIVEPGQTYTFAVCADNTRYEWIAPLDADFTYYGGIYRDVKLVGVPEVHFDLLDNGSDGLYVTALKKSDGQSGTGTWELTVKSVLVNDSDTDVTVSVSTSVHEPETFEMLSSVTAENMLFDADDMTGDAVIVTDEGSITISAGQKYVYEKTYTVNNPHLWNGKTDPFLYQTEVKIQKDGTVLDCVSDKIGFRTYSVDPDKGFFLNGVSYPLRGVSKHQDFDGVGNAVTKQMQDTDFGILYEIGANTVRLAHYPYVDYFYDLCDRYGLVVWAEVPFISYIGGDGEYGEFDENRTKFIKNVSDQLVELIRSQYNHPSILFWSMQNEVDTKYNSVMQKLMSEYLYPLTKKEDPNRIATFATFHEQGFSWKTDTVGLNFYPAWYGYETYHFTTVIADYHKRYPEMCLGVSEYGAGGSPSQHSETLHRPNPFADKFHPEEYQTYVHEEIAKQLYSGDLDFLWATYVWNLFDFGSDKRAEGDRNGINDKGLVSYDRTVKKDAFYVYKALWSNEPFVNIQSKRFTQRDVSKITIKASSNCTGLSLTVNGQSFGQTLENDGNGQFSWTDVPLELGENTVVLTGTKDGQTYTDTAVWTRVKSTNTGISSSVLNVDTSKKTIVLSSSFTADKVSDYIKTDYENASLCVLSADKTTVLTTETVEPFMYLRVTAEDGETYEDYQFLESNIGFGKTVTAKSGTHTALTDGKYNTKVSIENFGLTKELVIDLGSAYHVNNIVVYPANADYTYAVSVSTDGKTYVSASVTATSDSSCTALKISGKTARYIKLFVTGNSNSVSLSEIEVYGWHFTGNVYTVNELNRRIVTDTGTNQVADSVFAETLGISGNCTYEIVRSNSVFYISDGDKLKITDSLGAVTIYTICTDSGCTNNHSSNIALGKPVTASDPGQTAKFIPSCVNDGIIGSKDNDVSRWQAKATTYPQWLIIDLEDVYSAESYVLTTFASAYKDRYYGYKLYGSLDGEEYSLLVDNSSNQNYNGVHSGTFEPAYVRYIKLEITNGSKGSAGVYELEVYGNPSDKTAATITAKYPKMILAEGSREKIELALTPSFAVLPDDLTFVSKDETVAKVNTSGIVTGTGKGSTVITVSSETLDLSTEVSVTVSDKHALSLNRPVDVLNNDDQSTSTPRSNINDGSIDTRWQGKSGITAGSPTYIIIDLEKICTVDGFDVSFFNPANRVHFYEISVSTDGENYGASLAKKTTNDGYGTITFSHVLENSVQARYVRLAITGQSAGATPGVMEFTVYGEPGGTDVEALTFDKEFLYLGLGDSEKLSFTAEPGTADTSSVVWVSSNENAVTVENGVVTAVGLGGAKISAYTSDGEFLSSIDVFAETLRNISVGKKVVDYDDYGVKYEGGTGFKNTVENITDGLVPSSNFNFPRWHISDKSSGTRYAVIDLESVYSIEEIDLYFFYYNQRGYGYKISSSLDGENFTDVVSRLDNAKVGIQKESFENGGVYARYIRVDVNVSPSGLPNSTTGVYEISVYGKPYENPETLVKVDILNSDSSIYKSFEYIKGESFELPEITESISGTDDLSHVMWTDGTLNYEGKETYTVNSDTVLKPVLAPKSYGEYGIKYASDGKTGIRFKTSVSACLEQNSVSAGFIIALATDISAENLTFEYCKANGINYVFGTSMEKDSDGNFGKHLVFDTDKTTGDVFYMARAVGFDITNARQVKTALVVRPYVCDKDGNYTYGNPESSSVYESAQGIKNGGYYDDLDDATKEFIDGILKIGE